MKFMSQAIDMNIYAARIGNLALDSRVLAAPMAGVMDLPMRVIVMSYGAGMVFTEMISSEGIIRGHRKTIDLITCRAEEKPLGVQIFGMRPLAMAQSAVLAQERGADLIDINMGCPAKKVVKNGAGGALMKAPVLAQSIVSEVRKSVTIPVTVKLRAGWDFSSINYCELGKRAEDAGADAVILHPRTASQYFTGRADWNMVRELKEVLSIPVIGSGDIKTYLDAERRMEEFGADFAMIGRGAMGRPWLFCRGWESAPDGIVPDVVEILSVIERHIGLAVEYYGEARATPILRRHISYYVKGFEGAASIRRAIMEEGELGSVRGLLWRFFSDILTGKNGNQG